MREIRTEIEIDAPPEHVWAVLTDGDSYPEWNSFVTRLQGDLRKGGKLDVRIEPPEGRAMSFKPTVKRFERPREFRWRGRLMLPRLFDGEHIFELHPLDGGRTRFVQREQFRGVLVPFLMRMVGDSTEQGFVAMNEALKARAEASVATSADDGES